MKWRAGSATTEGLERSVMVAVSGWGAKEDLVRAKEAGFDMHFTKPVAPARVSDFLNSLA
jgi:CheY-like chemotaxis protein